MIMYRFCKDKMLLKDDYEALEYLKANLGKYKDIQDAIDQFLLENYFDEEKIEFVTDTEFDEYWDRGFHKERYM